MSFQMTVLWIAVFVFIALLAFIGYNIYSSQYTSSNWPPSVSECPDYWISDGKTCKSNLYNLCSGTSEFKITDYPNLCDKFDFAKKNKCEPEFNWSGISNSLTCNS